MEYTVNCIFLIRTILFAPSMLSDVAAKENTTNGTKALLSYPEYALRLAIGDIFFCATAAIVYTRKALSWRPHNLMRFAWKTIHEFLRTLNFPISSRRVHRSKWNTQSLLIYIFIMRELLFILGVDIFKWLESSRGSYPIFIKSYSLSLQNVLPVSIFCSIWIHSFILSLFGGYDRIISVYRFVHFFQTTSRSFNHT